MAFPNYQYPSYQAYYPQPMPDPMAQMRQNQMQQPMVQQPQQMNNPTMQPIQPVQPSIPIIGNNTQNSGIIWVNSKFEADNYIVAPNSAVALWDSNNPVIYLRQADSTGKPVTKIYDLVERTDDSQQQTKRSDAPQIDLSNFVTWDDFDSRVEEIITERLKRPSKPVKQKEDKEDGKSV